MHRPKIQRLGLIGLICAFILGHSHASAQSFTHHLISHQIIRGSASVVADVDGDNWDDVIVLGHPEEGTKANILAYSVGAVSTRPLRQLNFQVEVVAINAADLDRDNRAEILAIARTDDQIWLEIHYLGEDGRRVQGAPLALQDRDGSGAWAGVIGIEAAADLDEDGILDVIGKVNAGHDKAPRILVAFSGTTGNLIRELEIPGGPGRIRVSEVPLPDGPYIAVSTSTPDNGVRNEQFDDSNYYLLVFNREFKLKWHLRTAGYHDSMEMEIGDFDSDGRDEIVHTMIDEGTTNDQRHRLEIRDIVTGAIERYAVLPCNLSSMAVGDLDRDVIPEILAGLYDGALWVYDSNLERTNAYVNKSVQTSPRWVGDLTADGEPEIVAQQGANILLVLDSALQLIARRELDSPQYVPGGIHAGTNRARLLVSTEQDVQLVRVAPIGPSPTLSSPGTLLPGLVLFAVGVLVGAGALLFHRRRIPAPAHDDQTRVARGELLSDLKSFGHSGLAGVNLMRFAQYAEAAREDDDPRRADYERRLSSILHTYLDVTQSLLARIHQRASRIPGLKQKADGMTRPMHRLETLIKRNHLPERISKVSPGILADCALEARAAHKCVKDIRSSLMECYRCEVAEVALRVLAGKRSVLASNGMSSSISVEGEDLGRIDEDDLATCLEIVIQNAAEAMMQADSRVLRVGISNEDGAVVVRAADTGCGIPSEAWEAIFESGESSHGEGRGFGLFHARQSLARFGASIRVQTSSPDQGTIIAIRIPAVPPPAEQDESPQPASKDRVAT